MEKQHKKNKGVSKSAFVEWLEKLQQESWQLELLISGFALFGIYEARSLVGVVHDFRQVNPPSIEYFNQILGFIEFILSMGWRIFFINLLVHVISRGLWIGAIGLRYVSSDINLKKLNYSRKFEEYLTKKVGSFDDYIERLERFSSVIFAYTFLLFFIFVSFMIFCFWIILLASLSVKAIGSTPSSTGGIIFFSVLLLIMLIIFLGLIVFIDFITLGALKRVKDKHFSAFYFYLFRFYSFITLSFLYRPLMYNFLDEKYTRRLFLFSIPYVLFIALIPGMHSNSNPFYPIDDEGTVFSTAHQSESYRNFYYDDERLLSYDPDNNFFKEGKSINYISLEKRELSGSFGRLFLRNYPRDGRWLENNHGISPYYKEGILFPFQDKIRKDSLIENLENSKEETLLQIRQKKSAFRKQIRKGDIQEEQNGIIRVEGELKLDDAYWQPLQDSIAQHYNDLIEEEKKQKINNTKQLLLQLNEILIDDIPYTDSLTCHFYIHPNMAERGLLCYFPLDALTAGPHLMHLNRKRYNRKGDKLSTAMSIDIPFFIRLHSK